MNKTRILCGVTLATVFSTIGCSNFEVCYDVDLSAFHTEEMNTMYEDLLGEEYMEARACNAGAFEVVVPAKATGEHLMILKDREIMFGISGRHMSVFIGGEGTQSVSVSDSDEDGVVDMLSYHGVDKETGVKVIVTDEGIDGQADMRLYHPDIGDKVGQIWIDESWHDIVKRDGETGVIVDGVLMGWKSVDGKRILVERETR